MTPMEHVPPFWHGVFSQGSNFTERKTKRTLDADDKAPVPVGNIKDQSYNM